MTIDGSGVQPLWTIEFQKNDRILGLTSKSLLICKQGFF